MILQLLDALAASKREATHDQIADLIWLLQYVPASSVSEPPPIPPPPPPDSQKDPTGAANGARSRDAGTNRTEKRSEQTPPAPPPQHKVGELFAPAATTIASDQRIPVVPIRIAAAEALPGKAGLSRGLRPLKRRWKSRSSFVLDEVGTVDQFASGGPLLPVLAPHLERWLNVALVVDESVSMRIWRQTTRELATVLVRSGAFRDVRTWFLNLDQDVKLYSEPGLGNRPRRVRHRKELIDTSGRRAILIATDCMAPAWRDGSMLNVLEEWGRSGIVAIVQMLPQRMWSRTGLRGRLESLRTVAAGAPNRLLQANRSAKAAAAKLEDLKLPIITLDEHSISQWARMVAAVGEATAPGTVLARSQFVLSQSRGVQRELDPEKRVALARAQMSPDAFELAAYLAASPLVMPVMRLVQAAMMPRPSQTHLAEVLLGPLVQDPSPDPTIAPDQLLYEFHPGVRALMQERIHNADKLVVLRTVSRLIEQRLGAAVDWQALLRDPTGQSALLADSVGQKFAEIAPELLEQMGWTPPRPATPTYRGPMPVAAVAPTESYVATACGPGLNVWTLPDLRSMGTLSDPGADVCSLAAHDKYLLAGYADGNILVWDPVEGHILRRLDGHSGPVHDISVTGYRIVSASADGTIRIWDSEQGFEPRVLRRDGSGPIRKLAVVGHVALCISEAGVDIWNLQSRTLLQSHAMQPKPSDAAAAALASTALCVFEDGGFQFYDKGNLEVDTTFRVDSGLRCCALSPDGAVALLGCDDGSLQAVERSGPDSPRSWKLSADVSVIACSHLSTLVFGSDRGDFHVHHLADGRALGTITRSFADWLSPVSTTSFKDVLAISQLSCAPDGDGIAVRTGAGWRVQWNGGEWRRLGGTTAAWSPDGSQFASEVGSIYSSGPQIKFPDANGVAVLWVDNGLFVRLNDSGDHAFHGGKGKFNAPWYLAGGTASPDAPFYAFAEYDGTVKIAWRTEDVEAPKEFLEHKPAAPVPGQRSSVSFAWSREPGDLLPSDTAAQRRCPTAGCGAILDPLNRRCESCGVFWETCGKCGRAIHDFDPECSNCGAPKITRVPYKAVLYYARLSEDRIFVWHEDTEHPAEFARTEHGPQHLSCSHDGRLLAASFASGTVRIWSTETGLELPSIAQEQSRPAVTAEFHKSLPRLYTGFRETVQLWSYDPGVLLQSASLARQGKKILVVGTALYQLPYPVIYAARAIGQALAAAGFDMIGGGCQGVDYIVADAFCEELKNYRIAPEERFTQYVEQGKLPDYRDGHLRYVQGETEWPRVVAAAADAVIVIGGLGGSREASHALLGLGKAVICLPGTGDAARDLWEQLHGVSSEVEDFLDILDIPIETPADAEFAAAVAVAVASAVTGSQPDERAAAREGLASLQRFMLDSTSGADLLETGWSWNADLARQVLKAWLHQPPTHEQAKKVVGRLPRLFGSHTVVDNWFRQHVGATVEEWLARLSMLSLLPIAQRYLEPKPFGLYQTDVEELRRKVVSVSSREGIASCLRSDDMATRVLGYVAHQELVQAPLTKDLAHCFELERRDSRRSRETRPLWQLLVCVGRIPSPEIDRTLIGELTATRDFLQANSDLDPGRECRTRLELILSKVPWA